MNEMDRFRFNVSWYLYKLQAWWRDAKAVKTPPRQADRDIAAAFRD